MGRRSLGFFSGFAGGELIGFEVLGIRAEDCAAVDVIRGQFGLLSEIGTPEGEVGTPEAEVGALTGKSPRGAKKIFVR